MTFTECRPLHDPSTDYITIGTPMGSITFNPKTLTKTTYQPKILSPPSITMERTVSYLSCIESL